MMITKTSKRVYQLLRYILAFGLVLMGLYHMIRPTFFLPILPDFMQSSGLFWIYVSGVAELLLGMLLLWRARVAQYAAMGIVLMFVLYLPIHFIDMLRPHPVIGSKGVAYFRFVLQFIFILWAWLMARYLQKLSR